MIAMTTSSSIRVKPKGLAPSPRGDGPALEAVGQTMDFVTAKTPGRVRDGLIVMAMVKEVSDHPRAVVQPHHHAP